MKIIFIIRLYQSFGAAMYLGKPAQAVNLKFTTVTNATDAMQFETYSNAEDFVKSPDAPKGFLQIEKFFVNQ